MSKTRMLWLGAALLAVAAIALSQGHQGADLGFKDTPVLPGLPWHVHDSDRPHPPSVAPASSPGGAPSDATVLFDGKDLAKWASHGPGADKDKTVDARWKVGNGYFEVAPGTGELFTRERFGDCQLHIEWTSPT